MNLPILFKQTRIPLLTHTKLPKLLFSTNVDETIAIPKRIRRGPTDLLRALETTIARDPTAAHHKYHDDPYLIPVSNVAKRAYALAQEAGRKAAMWVRHEHSDLFRHQEMDPPIEAFIPRVVYTEKSEVGVEDLRSTVERELVLDAILVYKLLRGRDVEVGEGDRLDLLELVCFFNEEEALDEELIEERWFKQSGKARERQRKTWKDGGFAEELFISIDKPDSRAYSAIIQGMAKYGQADRAYQLYEEAREKGLTLNTDTYNLIIRSALTLRENNQKRLDFVLKIVTELNQSGLQPNLRTLNAVVDTLSACKSDRLCRAYIGRFISEFKVLGIEPSLGTYYSVLTAHYREGHPPSTALYEIMDVIEGKEFKIQDVKDTNFFATAMDVCNTHLQDRDLAERIHKLLHFKDNYDLIGNSYKESVYHRHYLSLLSATTPFDDFMQNTYNVLVPHIYVPEPSVMMQILKDMEASGLVEYIPQFWSDIKVFDHASRDNILHYLLDVMVESRTESEDLREKFAVIAYDIFTIIKTQPEERTKQISFTGELLGGIITLLLRNAEFEKAEEAMNVLDKNQDKIMGVPKLEALSLYVDECIKQKLPSRAISCIQYCSDNGYDEAANLAEKLVKSLTLSETYLNRLSNIIGDMSSLKQEAKS